MTSGIRNSSADQQQLAEPWRDDAQVEEPADGVLVGDVVVELTVQRIEFGKTRDTDRVHRPERRSR